MASKKVSKEISTSSLVDVKPITDNQKIIFDNVCCIYATAPFLQSSDLKKGLALLNNKEVSYSMPVTSYRFPIQRAIKINENKCNMDMLNFPCNQIEWYENE